MCRWNPCERKTLEEIAAGDGEQNPQTPPPPRRRSSGAASVGVPVMIARREDDILRPWGRTPSKREEAHARKRKIVQGPSHETPKIGFEEFVNGKVDESKSDQDADTKGKLGSTKEAEDGHWGERQGRGEALYASTYEGSGSVQEKEEEAAEAPSIQKEEKGSYIHSKERH